MSKTGWIILGSILGAGTLGTAIYFIWKNRKPSDVENTFKEETDKKKAAFDPTKFGYNPNDPIVNEYLSTLIEKIWIMDNTSKYTAQDAKGREDFFEKSRNLNRELQHKGLTYWRDDKTHNLDKNGSVVATLPRA